MVLGLSTLAGIIPLAVGIFHVTREGSQDELRELTIVLVFMVLIFGIVYTLLLQARLDTRIDRNMLEYRFTPLIREWRSLHPVDIEGWVVRESAPLREYRGWGIRKSFRRKLTAYTIRGKMVLEIKLTNGKMLVIGTQRSKELEMAMERLMQNKE